MKWRARENIIHPALASGGRQGIRVEKRGKHVFGYVRRLIGPEEIYLCSDWLGHTSPVLMSQSVITSFLSHTDDDCERRLQRLREVAAIKSGDLAKYASSSRSCEADDEFDDDEERGGDEETDPTAQEDEDDDENEDTEDANKD